MTARLLAAVLALLTSASGALAQGLPALTLSQGQDGTTYSLSFQILVLMSVLTVLPSLLLGMTAFTRIIIVLSILRQALGTQQTPPNQVLIALALFLTAFVMQPTLTPIWQEAVSPYLEGQISADTAMARGETHARAFLTENTRQADLLMFAGLAGDGPYAGPEDVPLTVLLPAFLTSELKTAFQIGFLIFLPFLVIDMVVASILMALGMMMLSPVLVSLPLKLLLFVMVDGWSLLLGSLAQGYGVQ